MLSLDNKLYISQFLITRETADGSKWVFNSDKHREKQIIETESLKMEPFFIVNAVEETHIYIYIYIYIYICVCVCVCVIFFRFLFVFRELSRKVIDRIR